MSEDETAGEASPDGAAAEPGDDPLEEDQPEDDAGPDPGAGPVGWGTPYPDRATGSGDTPWDASAADQANADGGDSEHDPALDRGEEPGDYRSQTTDLRRDFPKDRFSPGGIPPGSRTRDVAGTITHNKTVNYLRDTSRERRPPGNVGVADLAHAGFVHVETSTDKTLRAALREHRVVFCRGVPDTGRSHSATVILDRLTGQARTESKVAVLDGTDGLMAALRQLEAGPGNGYLLDAAEASWAGAMTRTHLHQARTALGNTGFLVILVDPDSTSPGHVIDHERPELSEVAASHLAAFLVGSDPDWRNGANARERARATIDRGCQLDEETRDWYVSITTAPTSSPAEAALFAEAIWDWCQRQERDSRARPRMSDFRSRHRYEQAAALVRRGNGSDSPLRQSYAISAAVLDGLSLNEVIDGASKLSALLAEVERPGEPEPREVFGQPLARWLRHVEITPAGPDTDNSGGAIVEMPSRELARTVIELVWREYDAARTPVLNWLKALCETHRDHRVRVRAVQALAFIAAYDYALVKEKVIDDWSTRNGRAVEQLAASWLLEAIVLDGTSVSTVLALLRKWSRSPERDKRVVAVRSYGTQIALEEPKDAIQGVRIVAAQSRGGLLPELAMRDMYLLGLVREVTEELTWWMRSFPEMRGRASRTLVWISRVRRPQAGPEGAPDLILWPEEEPEDPYDLLWRLAHTPDETGASIPQIAGLWQLACTDDSSRSAAWQMLGQWARSCQDYPELSGTFAALADELEKKTAGNDELRRRLTVYRRRWNSYLDEER